MVGWVDDLQRSHMEALCRHQQCAFNHENQGLWFFKIRYVEGLGGLSCSTDHELKPEPGYVRARWIEPLGANSELSFSLVGVMFVGDMKQGEDHCRMINGERMMIR